MILTLSGWPWTPNFPENPEKTWLEEAPEISKNPSEIFLQEAFFVEYDCYYVHFLKCILLQVSYLDIFQWNVTSFEEFDSRFFLSKC